MAQNRPYLKLRGHKWSARLRVPSHLVKVIGKTEIVRSLRTSDKREAATKLPEFLAECQALFQAYEGQAEPGSPTDIIGKAQAFRQELSLGLRGTTDKDADSYAEGLDYQKFEYLYPRGETARGLELDPDRGSILEPDQKKLDAFNLATRLVQSDNQFPFFMLSDALNAHLEEIGHRVRVQTVNARRRRVEHFKKWLGGDKEIGKITKQEAGNYLTNSLLKQGKSLKTTKDTLSDLSAFFRWCFHRGQITINPFEGLSGTIRVTSRGTKEKRDKTRRTFTQDELKKLLITIKEKKGADSDLWHLTLLGLFTGMRSNEIAEIELTEVNDTHIHVPEAKSESSVRDVPIHPVISDMVKTLKEKSTDGYLLSGLKRGGEDQKRNHYIGKRFGTLLRNSAKIVDQRVVFHSLRKNFATALETAGIPESTAQQIVGHKKQSLTYGLYSQGVDMQVLAKAVEKVSYGPEITKLIATAE